MTTDAAQAKQQEAVSNTPDILVPKPIVKADLATIFGLSFAIGLIIAAIALGSGNASFFNAPSFLIVILGTMAATSVAYASDDLKYVPGIIGRTIVRQIRRPQKMAVTLMDIAVTVRKSGPLTLSKMEDTLKNDPFLARTMQLVGDGYTGEDVNRLIGAEIDSLVERHRRSASIMRRASEIAPAMGLIGTLVGLVQMLANLDDPSAIGPAMAVALLTTFYGAILGTIVMAPLAAKLERNSNDEAMVKTLILSAAVSIADQENPRKLEMQLNSELPPDQRIRYFD